MKRIEYKEGKNSCSLTIDRAIPRAENPLKASANFLKIQKKNIEIAIFYSTNFDDLNDSIGSIYEENISNFIFIGNNFNPNFSKNNLLLKHFHSADDFLLWNTQNPFSGKNIVLLGEQDANFQTIELALSAIVQPTSLEINLDALRHNFLFFKNQISAQTKTLGMIKANAYGSGHLPIAQVLEAEGVDYLGVAAIDEAVELRRDGIEKPILVMIVTAENFPIMIHWKLEPVIYSLQMLKDMAAFAQNKNLEAYPIHIKFDTGMHRMGLNINELDQALTILNNSPWLKVVSLLSHLASADEPAKDTHTLAQYTSLQQVYAKFAERYTKTDAAIFMHIFNSAGTARFPVHPSGMVRIGLGLYGYSDFVQAQLQPIASLYTQIVQIKTLESGDCVGYNRRGELKRASRVGVIPVGYSDGINRHLSKGRGKLWFADKALPIIGTVSMNIISIDLSDAPEVKLGDRVYFFKPQHSAQLMANELQTIPYEILTSVSARLGRVFVAMVEDLVFF